MSNDEDSPILAVPRDRPGTGVDLARRMDRMEVRQDNIETEVRTLAATVARVEQNQTHAVELNKLRFDALDTGLKSVGGQLTDFIRRIESIITGEVRLPQNEKLMNDYLEWRKDVDRRLGEGEDARMKDAGVLAAVGGIRSGILLGAAVASPIVTVIGLVVLR